METNIQSSHGATCGCGSCQWNEIKAHHMGYRIARKVFLVFLFTVAFWFGTKYGEIKAFQHQARGGYGMMNRNDYGSVRPMMFTAQQGAPALAAPAAATSK